MADRKHTPDVLGDILGEVALVEPPDVMPSAPVGRRARKSRARPARRQPADGELAAPLPGPACWEYQLVSFQNYHGWRPRYINGAEIANWMAGPLIHDYLQTLGQEGWEVAGVGAGHALYGASDYHQVYFKRAVAE